MLEYCAFLSANMEASFSHHGIKRTFLPAIFKSPFQSPLCWHVCPSRTIPIHSNEVYFLEAAAGFSSASYFILNPFGTRSIQLFHVSGKPLCKHFCWKKQCINSQLCWYWYRFCLTLHNRQHWHRMTLQYYVKFSTMLKPCESSTSQHACEMSLPQFL